MSKEENSPMSDFKVEDHLTAEERFRYNLAFKDPQRCIDKELQSFLEALARCRAVMEENEFCVFNLINEVSRCSQCLKSIHQGHAPDCAWAACLAGVSREEKDDEKE